MAFRHRVINSIPVASAPVIDKVRKDVTEMLEDGTVVHRVIIEDVDITDPNYVANLMPDAADYNDIQAQIAAGLNPVELDTTHLLDCTDSANLSVQANSLVSEIDSFLKIDKE